MGSYFLRMAFVVFSLTIPVLGNAWQPWSIEDKYKVYWGDFESVEGGKDGIFDILLIPKEKFAMIASPVTFPIPLKTGLDAIMLCGSASGDFSVCTLADGFNRRGLFETSNFNFLLVDVDGDGIPEIFVHSRLSEINSIVIGADEAGIFIKAQFTHVNGHAVSGPGDVAFEEDEYGRNAVLVASSGYRASWSGSGFDVAPPSGLNYSLVGASPGSISVNSGRAGYSIPLNIVPGGGGVNPSLSLTYSSSADYGHAGMGFNLSLSSSVERCGRTYLRDGYVKGVTGTTEDLVCLDGNRLILVRGSYWANGSVYRTEAEAFQEIRYIRGGGASSDQGVFVVYDKNGDISRYGGDAASRVAGGLNGGAVARWALSSVEDRLGQGFRVEYVGGSGGTFPARIYYTVDPELGGNGYASVDFAYEEDMYGAKSSLFGQAHDAGFRLSRVTNRMHGAVVRQYFFSYEINPVTKRALLSSFVECGLGSDCLQPTSFSWKKATAPSFSEATYSRFPGQPSTEAVFLEGAAIPRFNGWVDINRDKVDDYCRISPIGANDTAPVEVICYISDGTGSFSSEIHIEANLSGWRFIEPAGQPHLFNWNVDPSWIDIDNDGFVDLCYSRALTSNDQIECRLNKAGSAQVFSTIISYEIPRPVSNKFRVINRVWTDINGDGLLDYCYDYMASNQKKYVTCAIQEEGFTFQPNVFTHELSDMGGSWVDVNGDGLPDYCVTSSSKIKCYINDKGQSLGSSVWEKSGSNFSANEPSNYVYAGQTTKWFNSTFIDFTGNGYPDYCRIYRTIRNNMHGYEAACLESKGNGWGDDIISAFLPLVPVTPGTVNDEMLADATHFIDINNDGKLDWCIERGYARQWAGADISCFLGVADGFGTTSTNYTLPHLGVDQTGIRGLREINRGWADIKGEGKQRYCALYWKSVQVHNRGMACYGSSSSNDQDLLIDIENGLGLKYKLDYSDLSNPDVYEYQVNQGAAGQIYVGSGFTVVSKLRASDGLGGLSEQSYFYRNFGYMVDERGGLGFEYERISSEQGKKKHEMWFSHDVGQHQAGQLLRTLTSYKVESGNFQATSEEHFVWQTDIFQGDGFVINSSENNIWNTSTGVDYRYLVWMKESVAITKELDGTLIRQTETLNDQDAIGNLREQTTTVTGIDQSFNKHLINTYQNYPTQWILGRLSRSTTTQSGNYKGATLTPITRTSAWEYYSASVSGIGGMLHKEIIEPDHPELRTETVYTYNQGGLKDSVTVVSPGISPRTSAYKYDPQFRFLIEEKNALGHTVQHAYDSLWGTKISRKDENGLVSYWDYDAIGRLKTETLPTGQRTQMRIGGCESGCPTKATYYTESWLESSTGERISGSTVEYMDVLGRVLESHSPGFSGETIIVQQQYDANGHVSRTSEPYIYGEQVYWNTVSDRDVLGRPLDELSAAGVQVSTEYGAYTTQQQLSWTDPVTGSVVTQTTSTISDLQGNMRVATDATQRVIHYQYDALDNLTHIHLPDNTTVENAYDLLGRRVASNDSNIGQWRYAYTGDGQIALQENGSGKRICFAYDLIGRVVGRVDDYAPSSIWDNARASAIAGCAAQPASTTWEYDDPNKGLDRLASTSGASGYEEELFYDNFGRNVGVEISYDGLQLSGSSSYDQATGRLIQETPLHEAGGPSVTIEYRYNSSGNLHEVGKPGLPDYYWRITEADARRQVTARNLANGMIQTRADHNAASGFLQSMRAKSVYMADWGIQNEIYTYDARGIMVERAQAIASLNQNIRETFGYDGSNRLISSSVANLNQPAASYSQSVMYDISGNIISRTDVGSYVYGQACEVGGTAYSPGPHAVTSVSGSRNASYCYDNGGNMIQGAGRNVSYSAFNKPENILAQDASVTISYGPSREILKIVTDSNDQLTTKYSLGGYERIIVNDGSATTLKERIALQGGVVISFEEGDAASRKEDYLIVDAVDSVVASVNALGGVGERYRYDPWGRPRQELDWSDMADMSWELIDRTGGPTHKGFSGHEMLDAVGLVHMGGRIYDPTIGRFLSADPIIKGLENPESYNRYSYVLNSPLSFTDPSGYSWLSKTWRKVERSFKKYSREILAVFNPQLALAESTIRYGGKELARFAAKNKYAGEVIGLAGVGACAFITGGTGAAGCVSSYQALTAGSMTYGSGGSIRDAIVAAGKSAALAYANASVATGIGEGGLNWAGSGVAHALRGGAFAAITGSDIHSGMVGGFVEGALGNKFEEWTDGNAGTGTMLAAFTSGAVSEITGGKFAVGALTGAMGYLLNQMSGRACAGRPCVRGVRGERDPDSFADNVSIVADIEGCFGLCIGGGISSNNADGIGTTQYVAVAGFGAATGLGFDIPLFSNKALSFEAGHSYHVLPRRLQLGPVGISWTSYTAARGGPMRHDLNLNLRLGGGALISPGAAGYGIYNAY